ncbi:MAG: GH39 family glycosyl hydrolase [Flavobacteriales bacterium]|jgi:xylan 1,4-beta-xylosidase
MNQILKKSVAFTLLLFSTVTFVKSQNSIINSGFENGLSGWGLVNEGSSTALAETVNTTFFSGNSCGKITLLEEGALGGFAQNVLLENGATYEVRCMCKAEALNGIALPYLNINNNSLLIEYGIIPISGTTDWYEAKARFISPEAATNATFFLFVQGSSGIAYFDDVTFTKISNQGNAEFSVDLSSDSGTVNPYMHVNAGPINPPFSHDLSQDFQDLRITSVRTHDFYGPCDIHSIFPDFNADANDPNSYSFEASDEVIAAIIATGSDVFFRLGESFSGNSLYNVPPADNQKMADICKNIVRHYNDGWNNGFNYNIEYWEIWNEPDLHHFWSGSAYEFTTMYGVIANTLKSYNPNLKIIGPAVSSMVSEWFVDEFLAGVSQFEYPLDGFSYHMYYMANPYGFVDMDQRAEQKLAQYGLQDIPHYLTEWNNYAYSSNGTTEIWRNDPFSGASTAASLIYLQETEIVQAHRYRANEFLFGLFDDNSNINYSGLAYQQFSTFVDHPQRLATTGGDSLGFALLAAQNLDGTQIQLSIANNSTAHGSYSIELDNIATDVFYTYTISRIDSTLLNQTYSSGTLINAAPVLQVPCSAPFVDKITLTRQLIDGVEEKEKQLAISLSPNPARDIVKFTISNDTEGTSNLLIIDAQGKIVKQEKLNISNGNGTLNVQDLNTGNYQIILINNGKVYNSKLVKK